MGTGYGGEAEERSEKKQECCAKTKSRLEQSAIHAVEQKRNYFEDETEPCLGLQCTDVLRPAVTGRRFGQAYPTG